MWLAEFKPIFLFQVEITKLKLDKDRKKMLDRKTKAKQADKSKGKYKQEDMET